MPVRTPHPLFDRYVNDLPDLVRGGRVVPAWSPDGQVLAWVDGTPQQRTAWQLNLESGERRPLSDLDRVRKGVTAATGRTPAGEGFPAESLAFIGARSVRLTGADGVFDLDLDTDEITALPVEGPIELHTGLAASARTTPRAFPLNHGMLDPQPAAEVPSPDGSRMLGLAGSNLVVRSTYDGRSAAVTSDGTPEVEWRIDVTNPALAMLGLAGPATCWAPNSTRVAAYRVDNRGVSTIPQVHWLGRQEEVVWRTAAKAGGVLERTTAHVVDVLSNRVVDLDLGDTTDRYVVLAGWTADSRQLVVCTFSRDCRSAKVLLADALTGATREVLAESSQTFVRIHHDIYFGQKTGLHLTPSTDRFVWLSERSGWQHLYLYDLEGRMLRQLTDGAWPVRDVVRVDDDAVLFTACTDQSRPYDVQLCRVSLDGGDVQILTPGAGVHDVVPSPDGLHVLDTCSSPTEPAVTVLRRVADGSAVAELSRADIAGLQELGFRPPEPFTAVAADGETELWGVMYLPADFDPERSYPVIEYVYGGPQIPVVNHRFPAPEAGFARHAQALAQLGYVTFVVDARGTPGRSKAFHDVVVEQRWAGHLAADHAAVVEQLGHRHAWFDATRVGVVGHSWGGYSAFRLAADRPDVYRAAVASAPGFDPLSTVLSECYLGLPQDDPGAYAFASCLPLAAEFSAELLIACGTSDHNTWTDAVKLSEELIRHGRQHELVVLPEQYHGYDSTHDSYFWTKVQAFFDRTLRT